MKEVESWWQYGGVVVMLEDYRYTDTTLYYPSIVLHQVSLAYALGHIFAVELQP